MDTISYNWIIEHLFKRVLSWMLFAHLLLRYEKLKDEREARPTAELFPAFRATDAPEVANHVSNYISSQAPAMDTFSLCWILVSASRSCHTTLVSKTGGGNPSRSTLTSSHWAEISLIYLHPVKIGYSALTTPETVGFARAFEFRCKSLPISSFSVVR